TRRPFRKMMTQISDDLLEAAVRSSIACHDEINVRFRTRGWNDQATSDVQEIGTFKNPTSDSGLAPADPVRRAQSHGDAIKPHAGPGWWTGAGCCARGCHVHDPAAVAPDCRATGHGKPDGAGAL